MDEKKASRQLIDKYLRGECTPEEANRVERFYMEQLSRETMPDNVDPIEARTAIWRQVSHNIQPLPARRSRLFIYAAAASVLLAIAGVGYFFIYNRPDTPPTPSIASKDPIVPGGNKATLVLADGRTINLSDAANGTLSDQSGISVAKTKDGQIVYTAALKEQDNNNDRHSPTSHPLAFNTIQTPIGGQYQVVLPDGTKVWLNAHSSLKYPVHFTGAFRAVELSGEAFFEVVHNPVRPFVVVVGSQRIEDLATQFNINAYEDEADIRTTLLQGKIRVSAAGITKVLTPGQQAVSAGNNLAVASADVEQTIAWKNGDFVFQNASLESIMRQISRWYDVDIIYDGRISGVELGGSISRSKGIKEVLKVLESTQTVHFRLDGRRITVVP